MLLIKPFVLAVGLNTLKFKIRKLNFQNWTYISNIQRYLFVFTQLYTQPVSNLSDPIIWMCKYCKFYWKQITQKFVIKYLNPTVNLYFKSCTINWSLLIGPLVIRRFHNQYISFKNYCKYNFNQSVVDEVFKYYKLD